MSKARLVITAIEVEGRTPAEVIAEYGVSRSWLYELLARYRAEGDAGFEPRSRRPLSSPRTTPQARVDLVLRLRTQLSEASLDAGADTIDWHLTHHHQVTLSRATINRILVRAGAVVPEPAKRPKSSYIRFEASMPTRPGSPTSPTTASPAPRAPPARTPRSSAGSTTTPATPYTSPPTTGSPGRSCWTPSEEPATYTDTRPRR